MEPYFLAISLKATCCCLRMNGRYPRRGTPRGPGGNGARLGTLERERSHIKAHSNTVAAPTTIVDSSAVGHILREGGEPLLSAMIAGVLSLHHKTRNQVGCTYRRRRLYKQVLAWLAQRTRTSAPRMFFLLSSPKQALSLSLSIFVVREFHCAASIKRRRSPRKRA